MEATESSAFISRLLELVNQTKASDLFLTTGFAPAIKVDGALKPVSAQTLDPAQTATLARTLMSDAQHADFTRTRESNFAISHPSAGRFRVNAYVQRGTTSLVLRKIPSDVPTIDGIGLPAKLKELAMEKRGMVIFVGSTGSGKTTSLAAMIDHRNTYSQGHIVTVEDPIEFEHPHKGCIVSQRELYTDTASWQEAIRNALRQAPDVVMMGEIRDRESMEHALQFAETGHLCLATLHANSANSAIERIVNFFPAERHGQVYMDLAQNMKALVSQRLLPRKGASGRVAAVEILVLTKLIQDRIFKGEVGDLKQLMKEGAQYGMQTFDQHLFKLFDAGLVTYEDAIRNADSTNDLRLQIKLHSREGQEAQLTKAMQSELTLAPSRP